jgi:hypothetical protein
LEELVEIGSVKGPARIILSSSRNILAGIARLIAANPIKVEEIPQAVSYRFAVVGRCRGTRVPFNMVCNFLRHPLSKLNCPLRPREDLTPNGRAVREVFVVIGVLTSSDGST